MRTLIVSNRLDPFNGNLGDFASDPSLYFPWLANARRVQLDRLGAWIIPSPRLGGANIIVGGGGLLAPNLPPFNFGWRRVVKNADPDRLVLWGAGLNSHLNSPVKPSSGKFNMYSSLSQFRLVGLRDDLHDYRWVPCPSVMLPEFSNDYPVEREAVVYDNWQFQWNKAALELPYMRNNRRFASSDVKRRAVSEVIAFLSSAETVLTSSYHGALWATLLGKKVVVTRPFSNKFMFFKHPPVILREDEEWREAAKRAQTYPDILGEYQQVTKDFADEVREIFGL